MNKSELNTFLLNCLRDLNDKNSRREWDVQGNDSFKCRLCGKTKPNSYRSVERVGFCMSCMGE